MSDDRLPTALWMDAHIKQLDQKGIPYYLLNKGPHASGVVMVKLYAPGQGAKLYQQQRNLDGVLGWMDLFNGEIVEERKADDYIRQSIDVDPDLWVLEIEDKDFFNPFEGPFF